MNPFVAEADDICDCRGSMKVHQICYELVRGMGNKCRTCKATMRKAHALDSRWSLFIDEYCYGKKLLIRKKAADDDTCHGPELEMTLSSAGTGMCYISVRSNYVDGLLNGPYKCLDEEGKEMKSGGYLNGEKHGMCIEKYDDSLILGGEYKNGLRYGVHIAVKDGVYARLYNEYVSVIKTTYEAGQREGQELTFRLGEYEKGTPRQEVNYADDKKHGWERSWFMPLKGDKLLLNNEQCWANGQMNGPRRDYREVEGKSESVICRERNYLKGILDGPQKLYDVVDGKPFMTELVTYRAGWLEGEQAFNWYFKKDKSIWSCSGHIGPGGKKSGTIVSRSTCRYNLDRPHIFSEYKDGVLHGTVMHIIMSPVSEVANKQLFIATYKNGVKNGPYGMCSSDGQVSVKLNYKNGLLHGECICSAWQLDSPLCKGSFKDGVPIGRHYLERCTIMSGTSPSIRERAFWREEIGYDDEGQLHGRCIYRDPDSGDLRCWLNYSHGVLAGRQVVYGEMGRELIVWNVGAGGFLKGRFQWFNERGEVAEERVVRADEELVVEDVLKEPITIYQPSAVELSCGPVTDYKLRYTITEQAKKLFPRHYVPPVPKKSRNYSYGEDDNYYNIYESLSYSRSDYDDDEEFDRDYYRERYMRFGRHRY